MILHLIMYCQCQRSMSAQEAEWPLCSKAESKGVKLRAMDEPGIGLNHVNTGVGIPSLCNYLPCSNIKWL